MSIQGRLVDDMKSAMKAGDKMRVATIRMLRAQLKNAQIAKGTELSPEDELSVLTKAAKIRKEAIKFYEQGEREDLLQKETQELEIISQYLPQQLSDEEVERIVVEIIERVGAVSLKDLGKVMPEAMKELKGKADGKRVQELVRKKLG
jgi:uncharacterized protein YqeY